MISLNWTAEGQTRFETLSVYINVVQSHFMWKDDHGQSWIHWSLKIFVWKNLEILSQTSEDVKEEGMKEAEDLVRSTPN